MASSCLHTQNTTISSVHLQLIRILFSSEASLVLSNSDLTVTRPKLHHGRDGGTSQDVPRQLPLRRLRLRDGISRDTIGARVQLQHLPQKGLSLGAPQTRQLPGRQGRRRVPRHIHLRLWERASQVLPQLCDSLDGSPAGRSAGSQCKCSKQNRNSTLSLLLVDDESTYLTDPSSRQGQSRA